MDIAEEVGMGGYKPIHIYRIRPIPQSPVACSREEMMHL
jgi:hypothetical protein